MNPLKHNFSENILSMLCKDAPYAWFLFDQAKNNSRYNFADFKEQADRLEAYLNAFGVALSDGYDISKWLTPSDWGSCFVLAVLGIRYDQPKLFDAALDNLNEEEETHCREIIDACLWDRQANASFWYAKLLEHRSPVAIQSALGISRSSRQEMPLPIFEKYINHESDLVKSQLFNWLGEQGLDIHLPSIQIYYEHENLLLAFSAARAGFLLGDVEGKNKLEKFALSDNQFMVEAISLIFIKEENQSIIKDWIKKLWASESISMRVKLYAISVAGLPETMNMIFQPMVDEETSRAAGETFSTISGVDIERYDLDANDDECVDCHEKEGEKDLMLAEKKLNDPFISDWEDDLPYPCPDATQNWWVTARGNFKDGTHYLAGLETTEENLKQILQEGNQRQRQLAAIHLFIKHQQPWFDCGWPPLKQVKIAGLE